MLFATFPVSTLAQSLIDSDNARIVETANAITGGLTSPRDKAVAIHDFVRDEIEFGWTGRFYEMRASQVLTARIGYCNTKSTLFVALLRAAGINARIRFVSLDADILHGLVETGRPYVDHSYAEVELDGRWIRTDSYIVDRKLFRAAFRRLEREGRIIGYGIHRNGTVTWDGERDAFAQFVDDGSVSRLSDADYGVFDDVLAFYSSGNGRDEISGGLKWIFPALIRSATQRVRALRESAPDA